MAHSKTFHLRSGKSFSDLKTLAKELKGMSQDIYTHHVNPAKNDFSNWVKNSLEKEDLAKRVDGHISKIELELEVLRHLLFEEGKKTAKKATKKKVPTKKASPAKNVTAPKAAIKKTAAPKKKATPKKATIAKKVTVKKTAPKKVVKKTAKKAPTKKK